MGIDIKWAREIAEENAKNEQERAGKKKRREQKYQKSIDVIERYKQGVAKKATLFPKLDCSACKSNSTMFASEISRFGGFIQFVGFIISFPAVFGVLVSVFVLLQSPGLGVIGICVSLASGLIGWLLLSKRKVYKCANCGFILERA